MRIQIECSAWCNANLYYTLLGYYLTSAPYFLHKKNNYLAFIHVLKNLPLKNVNLFNYSTLRGK